MVISNVAMACADLASSFLSRLRRTASKSTHKADDGRDDHVSEAASRKVCSCEAVATDSAEQGGDLTDTGIPNITFIDLTSYAGLTATGLLTLNLLLGLLLSMRHNLVTIWLRRRLPIYNLHNWIGYTALAVVLLHPVLLLPSATARFGWLDIAVPFWAPNQPLINSIGALATYALLFVVVTSYLRKRIGIRTWKKLHYTAYAVTVALFAHSLLTNPNLDDKPVDFTDGGKIFIEACAVIALAAISWRVLYSSQRSTLAITKP